LPYIKPDLRVSLARGERHESTAGELNYSFTKLIIRYLENHGECYQTYNDILGSLTACQMELYRRKIGKYEDLAINKNTDVY
jgi:hypothetical protein